MYELRLLNVWSRQVNFKRRRRLSEEKCEASRGYYDVCLANKADKETIFPGGAWAELRPDKEVAYIEGKHWVCVHLLYRGSGRGREGCLLLWRTRLDGGDMW